MQAAAELSTQLRPIEASKKRRASSVEDWFAHVFLACALVVVLGTIAVFAYLLRSGVQGVANTGIVELITGTVWKPEAGAFGGLALVTGTLATALGATALGAAPAILGAVVINELASKRAYVAYRRTMEVAASVPSVVFGWMALRFLVPASDTFAHRIYGQDAAVSGEGLAVAAVLLSLMIGPTVSLLTLDALARVPRSLREASAALGASPLQTALRMTLPTAWRGVVAAVFFGFARAAGETMAVQMVIGGARKVASNLFQPTTTISTQIVMDMQNTLPGTTANQVLYSMALVLLVVSTGVVLAIRLLGRRAT